MAKGNALIGTLHRSVGDVTFFRRNGVQLSRARIRKIANPKTVAQANQRMKTPVITRFYSAFRTPLERSWEGQNKSNSYSAFLKFNTTNFVGPYVEKGSAFIPGPFRVSMGTIAPLSLEPSDDFSKITLPFDLTAIKEDTEAMKTPDSVGVFSRLMIAQGYQQGDQITVLAVKRTFANLSSKLGRIEPTYVPYFSRFVLLPNDSQPLINVMPQSITTTFKADATSYDLAMGPMVAFAIIVSRQRNDGVWLRSTSEMIVSPLLDKYFTAEALQISSATYQKASSNSGSSAIYLNNAGLATVKTIDGGTFVLRFNNKTVPSTGDEQLRAFVSADGSIAIIQNNDKESTLYKQFLIAGKSPTSANTNDWTINGSDFATIFISAEEAAKFV